MLTGLERYDAYYDGKYPLAYATSKFREAFAAILRLPE